MSQTHPFFSQLAPYANAISRSWKMVASFTCVGLLAGIAGYRWVNPTYTSQVVIQVATEQRRSVPNARQLDMVDLLQSDSKSETEIELVQTNSVVDPVVRGQHLGFVGKSEGILRRLQQKDGSVEIDSLRLPALPDPTRDFWRLVTLSDLDSFAILSPGSEMVLKGRVGSLSQVQVGKDTLAIQVASLQSEPGETFRLAVLEHAEAVDAVQSKIKVSERGRKTGVIELSFTSGSPEKAQRILNALAASYIERNVEVRAEETRKSIDFLQRQILPVKARLDSLEDILNGYRLKKGTVDIGAEARVALDEQSRIQQQLLALDQQKQELLRLYRPDHPAVAAIDAQRTKLEQALAGSSRQMRSLPLTQQQIQKLNRDIDVNQQLYTSLLNNIQQLQVVMGGQESSARIVDPAERPARPSRKLAYYALLAGILGGFGLGAMVAVSLHLARARIESPADLEEFGFPVHSQIPESSVENSQRRTKGKRPALASLAPDDLAIETLRAVRANLEWGWSNDQARVLAVTGPIPGVGKSFVARNLAVLFAQIGRRVVLVDADLRRGSLHDQIEGQDCPGLAELILGEQPLESLLRPTGVPGLLLLGKGMRTSNPSDLLASPRFSSALETLAKHTDVVIVDTSPLLLVSDALHAMSKATQSVIVLEANRHPPREIREVLRRIGPAQINKLGFVLNHCELSNRAYQTYTAPPART